jgi:hypothetical protein
MGKSNLFIAKNKVGLVRRPQLIDMKQNKHPQTIMGVLAQVQNAGKHF